MKVTSIVAIAVAAAALSLTPGADAQNGRIKSKVLGKGNLKISYDSGACTARIRNVGTGTIEFGQNFWLRTFVRSEDGREPIAVEFVRAGERTLAPGEDIRVLIEGDFTRRNNCEWRAWFNGKFKAVDAEGRTLGGSRVNNTSIKTRSGRRF